VVPRQPLVEVAKDWTASGSRTAKLMGEAAKTLVLCWGKESPQAGDLACLALNWADVPSGSLQACRSNHRPSSLRKEEQQKVTRLQLAGVAEEELAAEGVDSLHMVQAARREHQAVVVDIQRERKRWRSAHRHSTLVHRHLARSVQVCSILRVHIERVQHCEPG